MQSLRRRSSGAMGSRRRQETTRVKHGVDTTSTSNKVSSRGDTRPARRQLIRARSTMPSASEYTPTTNYRRVSFLETNMEKQSVRLPLSSSFCGNELRKGNGMPVFATELPDTDTCSIGDDSTGRSSQGEESDLDRGMSDVEDGDGYDTELESDEESYRHHQALFNYDLVGADTYLEECERLCVAPVAYFLRNIRDPELVMKHHGLGYLDMKALAKPLQNNTTIETIDLEGNHIGPKGAKYLTRALKDNVFVTRLGLADNNIGSNGVEFLCKMLSENYAISTLDLSSNNFKDTDGRHFHNLLFNNLHLTTVSLGHNHFEDDAAMFLSDAIVDNSILQVLDLSWNKFRMKGAEYITDIILKNDSLTHLDLSMNGLSDDGARLVGRALVENDTLQELNISGNRIGIGGAWHIGNALEKNNTLHTLRIGNNPLGTEGAGAFLLLEAIQKNLDHSSLSLLDVMNVVVRNEFERLHKEINASRTKYLQVIHGGVLFHNKHSIIFEDLDPNNEFERDPMTKLKKYADRMKFRLIDVFRQFDKNNDWRLTLGELVEGVQVAGLDIPRHEVRDFMRRLDRNGDGTVGYEELMYADEQNRTTKRQIDAFLLERAEQLLIRPSEVSLNLGTVTSVANQLDVTEDRPRQSPRL